MPKLGMEEIRKDQVIKATERCIVEKGYSNMSVKDISAMAKVSTGIIYHYFKNKEDLLLQVLKESFRKSHEQVMETVEPLRTFDEKLMKHIENINRVPVDNPDFYAVMLNFLGQTINNPEINGIIAKFFGNLRSYISQYIQDGIEVGRLQPEKAKHLSALTVALGMGIGMQWIVDPESFDIVDIEESYKEMIESYILLKE
ncbi:transcriptional regulator [Desulfosporosinus orientis DSM 765]|uniref:Transcriptional regulator n=1 Tax=Desulfosporosinus orientis (strain ATCC 19365 / DSM 765 / NCIMB 8382 / VKM B-1628 / Singapore I) TaxID=768706 RepID=G7WGP7_DESOD|nr:TetR/AcrR family transcriptional regulator [Desulfosporosinus orientis]AET68483.1 transcriptional regulator [Desulfosporosinus orientis DSM 765]